MNIAEKTIKQKNWYYTPNNDPRGYIQPKQLQELWFHTGTACNLECPFCLEGSSPADKRLDLMKLEDVKSFIDQAVSMGVKQFSFTGGEPFVAKQFHDILAYAAEFNPCLVLTNGTDAVRNRFTQIENLKNTKHPISFRISIDYPDAKKHDAGRGQGRFDEAMQTLADLHQMGFHISLARQMDKDENKQAVENEFQKLFRQYQIPEDILLVAFPDFLTPGSLADVPHITEHCMTHYQTEESRNKFMCTHSKMMIKINGQMRIYACTLVDDDPDYDLGNDLITAQQAKIMLKHHRCYSCFAYGSSCSEL